MEYKYKKDLDKNIFRGYDIRGIYPTNIDEDTAYTFGLPSFLFTIIFYQNFGKKSSWNIAQGLPEKNLNFVYYAGNRPPPAPAAGRKSHLWDILAFRPENGKTGTKWNFNQKMGEMV